jgi:predicted Zn-dependent peptidase
MPPSPSSLVQVEEDLVITTLENGLRVASQHMPGVRTASVGIWAAAGSRHEASHQEGVAHFSEHMAFKGTPRMSPLDIATRLDRIGGASGAFTGRETTCFHARTVHDRLFEAFGILADMVIDPLLDPADVELEKGVVLQEIAMVLETPEDDIHDRFWERAWSDASVGHPILGNTESVLGFEPERLRRWQAAHYRPDNLLVSAAGAVDHDELVRAAAVLDRALAGDPLPSIAPARYTPFRTAIGSDLEQTHVIMGFPSVSLGDERRIEHSLLSSLLGGQMSSRLFQEIRERRGLAYNIYAGRQAVSDAGLLQIYAGTHPERAAELVEVLLHETTAFAQGRFDEEELAHGRDHLQAQMWLAAESSEERMMRIARNVLFFGRHISYQETADRIADVTFDDLRDVARAVLDPARMSILAMGPGASELLWRDHLPEMDHEPTEAV